MKKSKEKKILIILIILLFVVNYPFLDSVTKKFFEEKEKVNVLRVIDGDTIETEYGEKIRFLGINTPERGEKYYLEAKEFLERLILNYEIGLENGKTKYDLYKRRLAHIYVGNKNINLELVKEGYANPYFPSGKDKYSDIFYEAFKNCEKNLCEKSVDVCARCIELEKLDYKNQEVILKNSCFIDCSLTNWTIKDEGRKKFVFPEFILKKKEKISIKVGEIKSDSCFYWEGEKYVWTESGDSLILRDKENKLVLYYNY